MLKNRAILVAIAAAVLLAMRFLPGPQGSGPAGAPPGLISPGSSGSTDVQGSRQAKPTPQPAVIDPSRLQGSQSPFLVLRASAIKQGAPVVVGGQSFPPYQELTFSLHDDGGGQPMELGTATTDKNGVLPDVSLPLPEGLKEGSYSVVAAPTLGGPSVEASLRVGSDQNWGRLTGTTAKPGETTGFEGGGFKPGETVTLHLDNLSNQALAAVEASEEGAVSGTFSAPLANEGDHVILFYGDQGKTPVIADLNIQGFYPWVVLDNYSPAPEQSVGFAGSDFTPGEKVYVFLNSLDTRPAAVVQVEDDGSFKAPSALTLGPGVQGSHKLLFVGEKSQMEIEAEFTVLPYPASLQLTIYAGPPGSEVAFVGSGFSRGEEIRAYVGEPGTGDGVSSFKADSKGNFSGAGSFRVPRDIQAGDLTLSVAGQVSGAHASVNFTVIPLSSWAEASPDRSGLAVVVGHGFAPGEVVDLIAGQSGDKPLATTAADRDGNARFSPLEIPVEGPGKPASIRLKGRESGGEAKAEYYGNGEGESGGESPSPEPGNLEFQPSSSQTPSTEATPSTQAPAVATPTPGAG